MTSDGLEGFLQHVPELSCIQGNRGFEAAKTVIAALRTAGYASFCVGGAVRDLVLGCTPADWDIVTVATPEEVLKVFPDSDLIGAGFGVVIVKTAAGNIEVASARRERFYMDGRHPEKVEYTRDIAVDLQRRDFTINALLLDPESGIIYDNTGGLEDIRKGIIRTIGDAGVRFREDYLRMLRCIRFAARLNFVISADTFSAITELAPLAAGLAPERIRSELDMIITGKFSGKGFRLLEHSGLLKELLPEAAVLRTVKQPPEYHPEGDVLEHTLIMLEHLVEPSLRLAWGVFFHDFGKALSCTVTETGRIHFFGHEKSGLPVAESVMNRLRFSKADIKDILYLVENHIRFGTVKAEAKLRRYEGHVLFVECMELNRLDAIGGNKIFDQYLLYLDRIISGGKRMLLPQAFINGDDLIAAGYKPGKKFKEVLTKTFDAQLEGVVADKKSALAYAGRLLAQ